MENDLLACQTSSKANHGLSTRRFHMLTGPYATWILPLFAEEGWSRKLTSNLANRNGGANATEYLTNISPL